MARALFIIDDEEIFESLKVGVEHEEGFRDRDKMAISNLKDEVTKEKIASGEFANIIIYSHDEKPSYIDDINSLRPASKFRRIRKISEKSCLQKLGTVADMIFQNIRLGWEIEICFAGQ